MKDGIWYKNKQIEVPDNELIKENILKSQT